MGHASIEDWVGLGRGSFGDGSRVGCDGLLERKGDSRMWGGFRCGHIERGNVVDVINEVGFRRLELERELAGKVPVEL